VLPAFPADLCFGPGLDLSLGNLLFAEH
jgi:hypothetical protein